jgi:hypothetical protein
LPARSRIEGRAGGFVQQQVDVQVGQVGGGEVHHPLQLIAGGQQEVHPQPEVERAPLRLPLDPLLVVGLHLEVRAGGVVQKEVHVQVEQIRRGPAGPPRATVSLHT